MCSCTEQIGRTNRSMSPSEGDNEAKLSSLTANSKPWTSSGASQTKVTPGTDTEPGADSPAESNDQRLPCALAVADK